MKAGKYSIRELFSNRYIEQIVVPEIQRDYVWGKEQVTGLLNSIISDFNKFRSENIELSSTINLDIADAFREYYRRQVFSSNIGFIYAYNDPEYDGKYFLIDGQQRITTVYILLLALAGKVESFQSDFKKIYLDNNKLKLDYKVREASHDFLRQFVHFALDGIGKVTDQPWYYKEYESDATISSIVRNYGVISDFLDNAELQLIDFSNYLQDFVDLWYFDTNISEQGEELYIYMNARGEQMQGNENLKADILSSLTIEDLDQIKERDDFRYSKDLDGLKKYWGLKWEEWQDFFWKNRKTNSNADAGFNNFLLCVAGLENFIDSIEIFYSKDDFEKDNKGKANDINYSDLQNSLGSKILRIEKYVNALRYLEQNVEQFKEGYDPDYCGWCKRCLDEIWSILNTGRTNWFADYRDENRGTEVSRMVFIWSILYYLSSDEFASRTVSVIDVFRTLRILFVRFKNFNRAIMNITNNMDAILESGPFHASSIYVEENHKHDLYQSCQTDLLEKYEALIWKIEDHPYNLLEGRNLRNANIGHLVNFKDNVTIDQLVKIKDLFYFLFPVSDKSVRKSNNKILQSLLLCYGKYWYQDSPYYYHNYCFGEWPRIIRDMDSEGNVFFTLFTELLSHDEMELSDMFERKSSMMSIDFSTTDLREQLLWYAIQLKDDLWKQGDYIAVRTDWEGNDKVFPNSKKILNTKGDFKGGSPAELSTLIPETSLSPAATS